MLEREIVVRFAPGAPIFATLRRLGATVARRSAFVPGQLVLQGGDLDGGDDAVFQIAEALATDPTVVFAVPGFVSQYRRAQLDPRQWHLRNDGPAPGQRRGEDLRAEPAWEITKGASRMVAVLDDGVDIDHPALSDRVWTDPDNPARRGRDFFLPSDDPGHFDPHPKTWNHPFDDVENNDIHGTACAGLVAANGAGGFMGVSPACTLLPVKIFHASRRARDERVAEAIRFAALGAGADVISCSWDCGYNTDVEQAVLDALELGRGGKGSVVVFSAGNDHGASVTFPANVDGAIAVSASTDRGEAAEYSNRGPAIAVAGPSSGGVLRVATIDVSLPGRGYDRTGNTTDQFGGTSAAAAMVAGAAALLLAVRPDLRAGDVRAILMETADKIGSLPYFGDRNDALGAGRVNLDRAVGRARTWP